MDKFMGDKCETCQPGLFGQQCEECQCNFEGSLNTECNLEGKCNCKENFMGDKCDTCKPGFFGQQCEACNCDQQGSLNTPELPCNSVTGQCDCISSHVEERTCNKCKSEFYGFPNCQPCNCKMAGRSDNNCN